VETVQNRAIVQKLSAGQKIQVSSFAITLLDPSGRILHLLSANPAAMQVNRVSIGVRVAIKVVILNPRYVFLAFFRHFARLFLFVCGRD
jgi:hypothetical protein